MSLKYVLLTALSDGPCTGYDLKKKFEEHFNYFWRASHQQIYRELKTLNKSKWISCEEVEQDGKPDKKIYTLTNEGKLNLKQWAIEFNPTTTNDEILVKMLTYPLLNFEQINSQIEEQLEFHQNLKLKYQSIEKEHFPSQKQKNRKGKELLVYLSLQRGILINEAKLKWCNLVIKELRRSE
jgi:DNA-binding PadR family transcriptional regulator